MFPLHRAGNSGRRTAAASSTHCRLLHPPQHPTGKRTVQLIYLICLIIELIEPCAKLALVPPPVRYKINIVQPILGNVPNKSLLIILVTLCLQFWFLVYTLKRKEKRKTHVLHVFYQELVIAHIFNKYLLRA